MISPLRHAEKLERAQGALLGQLVGDALGSLVEFQTPELIQREYTNGVRELADGEPRTRLRPTGRRFQDGTVVGPYAGESGALWPQ